jgi:uncharacterized protein (UPF0332 family)
MLQNLNGVLDASALAKIQAEIDRNVEELINLGESHFNFAKSINQNEWRQVISRLYYAAYNIKRAVSLRVDGSFSTDSSDHQKIGELPKDFTDVEKFSSKLKNLRDDRNLADYSHDASESDLLIPINEAGALVADFINQSFGYLRNKGMTI